MIHVFRQLGVTILELRTRYDSLDASVLDELGEALMAVISQTEVPPILLDLSQTEYIASGFIEVLLRTSRRIKGQPGGIAFCGASPFCRDVLETMRLNTLWPIYAGRDQALRTLANL